MFRGNFLQLGPQQDVVLRLVGEYQPHFRPVTRVLQRGSDELQHRGDASATGDHANLFKKGGGGGNEIRNKTC